MSGVLIDEWTLLEVFVTFTVKYLVMRTLLCLFVLVFFLFPLKLFSQNGCTDSFACNYDALAVTDDGSCDYSCVGCMDPRSCEYDPAATIDSGLCFHYSSECDFNCDDKVSALDYLIFMDYFDCYVPPDETDILKIKCDLDHNAIVGVSDLIYFIQIYGLITIYFD